MQCEQTRWQTTFKGMLKNLDCASASPALRFNKQETDEHMLHTHPSWMLFCLFLKLQFSYNISPFSILLLNLLMYPLPTLLQINCLLFSSIAIACIYVYIYILKYNLLSPYNVTCIHVFWGANHLTLFFPGKGGPHCLLPAFLSSLQFFVQARNLIACLPISSIRITV